MSSPEAKPLKDGRLEGTLYTFRQAGDVLPMHKHGDLDKHYTFVTRGKIRAFGPWGERIASAGEVLRFRADQDHAFEALEDDSRVANIVY